MKTEKILEKLNDNEREEFNRILAEMREVRRKANIAKEEASKWMEHKVKAAYEQELQAAREAYAENPCDKTAQAIDKLTDSLENRLQRAAENREIFRTTHRDLEAKIKRLFHETDFILLVQKGAQLVLRDLQERDAEYAKEYATPNGESHVTKACKVFVMRVEGAIGNARTRANFANEHRTYPHHLGPDHFI